MVAKIDAYQRSFAEAGRTPSEEDFTSIQEEFEQIRVLEVRNSVAALKMFFGSGHPVGEPVIETMVEDSASHGYSRVNRKWNVWRTQAQLKSTSTKIEEPEKQRDALVPTYNRREFYLDLPRFTSESNEARPLSLVFLDVDDFKSYNTQFLHVGGDSVLKACAAILLLASDGKGSVYRYGGDEFCVLLPNHSIEEATAVAVRILRKARAARTTELRDGLRTSIGVAESTNSKSDPAELLKQANAAMYVSKDAGGDRASVTPADRSKTEEAKSPALKVWEKLGKDC